MQRLTKNRVCLAPEVARSHHASGNTGATINQLLQNSNFDSIVQQSRSKFCIHTYTVFGDTKDIRLSDVEYADLHPQQLSSREYDEMMAGVIENGIFVWRIDEFLDYQNSTLLVYVNTASNQDSLWNVVTNWFNVSSILF